MAKAVIRKLIRAGIRKGPSELLVMEDRTYETWLEEDAVAFLREQKAARQAVIAVLE